MLLTTLFKHHGSIVEFGAGERIVDEMAEELGLTDTQTSAHLETIYRKENREKRSSLWHRLLFRAADSLAKRSLVSRPTAYSCSCAICGLKLSSPDSSVWEVEAAHIVPHSAMGKDDVWNGLALCRFHHWAFDVGWFAFRDDYSIQVSPKLHGLPVDFGRAGDFDFMRLLVERSAQVRLPANASAHPHRSALAWHRENLFHR